MDNPFEVIMNRLDKIERLITNNHQMPAAIIAEQQILDIDQAAEFLRLSKPTLYKKTSGSEIPYFKRGRRVLFKRSELLLWIESSKVLTKSEAIDQADRFLSSNGKSKR